MHLPGVPTGTREQNIAASVRDPLAGLKPCATGDHGPTQAGPNDDTRKLRATSYGLRKHRYICPPPQLCCPCADQCAPPFFCQPLPCGFAGLADFFVGGLSRRGEALVEI